uniref:Set1 complex component spp1-like n=1 Tax=Crassostrea virginica TaxID=6565 RepID=A0A8B8C2Q0_CRAVI|nr:set1 complex component spp1-like [Crassostrea virginica]
MHHDKLRPCISRKLPKWIRDYQARSSDQGVPDCQTPLVDSPTPPPATKANKAQNGRDCSAPYLGTRSRTGALNSRQNAERDSVSAKGRNRPAKRAQYKYCLCKSTRPAGLMVQCNTCKDWFHPKCVGETEEHVKTIPTYHCPDCTLVVG